MTGVWIKPGDDPNTATNHSEPPAKSVPWPVHIDVAHQKDIEADVLRALRDHQRAAAQGTGK